MNAFIRILTLGVVLMAGFSAHGQSPAFRSDKDRMALIDSLSRPKLAKGSEAMHFDELRIEAGEMNEDSAPSEYIFHWTNMGSSPLSVTWVQTTCGCAAPSYERGAVQPGDRGTLKITYHPKGHPGGFLRKIFVYTNLSEKLPSAVLELSGKVTSSVLPTGDYPVAMGGLLLKRSTVDFSGNSRRTERIECMNAGDKSLEISVDPKTLPKGVQVDPLKIAPGEIADLVLRFDPSKADGRLPATAPVFLKGIPLQPTKCMITINFK